MRLRQRVRSFLERVERVLVWLPVIWNDFDYDWSPVYQLLAFKLRRLADHLEHGCCLDGPKYAREARIAALLCDRIVKDDYWDSQPPLGPWKPFRRAKALKLVHSLWYEEYMIKQDLDYLHRYLTKHVRSWWD